jgi:hypothetical protein
MTVAQDDRRRIAGVRELPRLPVVVLDPRVAERHGLPLVGKQRDAGDQVTGKPGEPEDRRQQDCVLGAVTLTPARDDGRDVVAATRVFVLDRLVNEANEGQRTWFLQALAQRRKQIHDDGLLTIDHEAARALFVADRGERRHVGAVLQRQQSL